MACTHLKELYALCERNGLRLGSSDLVRVVCRQCQHEETCPSMLMDQVASDDQPAAESGERRPPSSGRGEAADRPGEQPPGGAHGAGE